MPCSNVLPSTIIGAKLGVEAATTRPTRNLTDDSASPARAASRNAVTADSNSLRGAAVSGWSEWPTGASSPGSVPARPATGNRGLSPGSAPPLPFPAAEPDEESPARREASAPLTASSLTSASGPGFAVRLISFEGAMAPSFQARPGSPPQAHLCLKHALCSPQPTGLSTHKPWNQGINLISFKRNVTFWSAPAPWSEPGPVKRRNRYIGEFWCNRGASRGGA